MREIVLDTETTGLNPDSGHKVIEIGCVELVNRIRTGKSFHAYLNPQRDVPKEAFQVHGISTEFLSDKPLFADVAESFLDFIRNAPLVIHNAEFDIRFLNAELRAIKRDTIPIERAIDTVLIARKKFPGSPANLDALCKRFNIDLSARTLHGALLDAELLALVYLELTGGSQVNMFAESPSNATKTLSPADTRRLYRAAREFMASEEEMAAHKAFLAKLKQPVWEEG